MASTFTLSLAACVAPGDRAYEPHQCPVGETCSDVTPDGLYFQGDDAIDPPGVTAVGGTQTITVLLPTRDRFTARFTAPFDAVSSGPALVIARTSPPSVTVAAAAAGGAYLRILERGTNLLYDRILLETQPIQRATVRPDELPLDDTDPGDAWVLLAGKRTSLRVNLLAASGHWLADETLRLQMDAGGDAVQLSWNVAAVTAAAAGTVTLRATPGDQVSHTFPVRVASALTDIVPTTLSPRPETPIAVGAGALYCFRPLAGSDLVAGADFSFSASGSLSVSGDRNCASVTATAPGIAMLTASAEGFAKTFLITVRAGARRTAPAELPAAPASPSPPAPGERAATHD